MKWQCKICKNKYKTKQDTCLQCGITKAESRLLFICNNCGSVNDSSETNRCITCGQKRKTSAKSQDLISKEALIHKISICRNKPWNDPITPNKRPMQAALISALYLTASRESELIMSIRKQDIDIQEINNTPFLIIHNLPTLKRRSEKGNINPRSCPINMIKEKEIVTYLLEYIEKLNPQDILFPFSANNCYRTIKRHFGNEYYPHYLRHLRLSHLAQYYGFDALSIQAFVNWKSISSTNWYVHLNSQDIAKKMI